MTTLRMMQAALAANPSDPAGWLRVGNAFSDREDHELAIWHVHKAMALARDSVPCRAALARVLEQANRLADATAELREIIRIAPQSWEPRARLAQLLLHKLHEPQAAVDVVFNTLGMPIPQGARFPTAVSLFGAAEACGIDDSVNETKNHALVDRARATLSGVLDEHDVELARAMVLARRGAFDDAKHACDLILAHVPDHAITWALLANVEATLGNADAAAACMRRATEHAPADRAVLGFWLSYLMGSGQYQAVAAQWERFESLMCPAAPPQSGQTRWTGEDLAGKTVELRGLAGFGDTIMFVRSAAELRRRGATVRVQTRSRLTALIETAEGVSAAYAPHDDDSSPDYTEELSAIWVRLDPTPPAFPYLHPPSAAVQRWATSLAAIQDLRVGLVWSGEPISRVVPAVYRSAPFEQILTLSTIPGVQCFSLQVGPAALPAGNAECGGRIIDLAAPATDFVEMAAAILALDVVVSVDTSIAHLAGALNKPVLLMVPRLPCWRWQIGRSDSVWYPTVRLFRQQTPGDWRPVIENVRQALQMMATEKHGARAVASASMS